MQKDIYIQLLDEGTVVYRPVPALQVNDNVYRLEGYDIYERVKDDEVWEFTPGMVVIVEEKNLSDGAYLVAVREK